VLENDSFGLGFESALLEPIRRVIQQLTAGLHRPVEHSQEVLLDKGDMAVLALGQERHELIKVLPCGLRIDGRQGKRRSRQHDAQQAAPSGPYPSAIRHWAHAKNQKS
jgi:hypothetical protein